MHNERLKMYLSHLWSINNKTSYKHIVSNKPTITIETNQKIV